MRRRQHVGAAEGVGEPDQPDLEIGRRAARRGRPPEDDGLGTVLLFDLQEASGDRVKGLLPRDLYPTGIGIALGAGALHRMEQPVRRIDNFWRGISLDADAAVRVLRVGCYLGEAPVFNHGDDPALRDAHRAISMDFLGSHYRLPTPAF